MVLGAQVARPQDAIWSHPLMASKRLVVRHGRKFHTTTLDHVAKKDVVASEKAPAEQITLLPTLLDCWTPPQSWDDLVEWRISLLGSLFKFF